MYLRVFLFFLRKYPEYCVVRISIKWRKSFKLKIMFSLVLWIVDTRGGSRTMLQRVAEGVSLASTA